jgi:hypothetical protein
MSNKAIEKYVEDSIQKLDEAINIYEWIKLKPMYR